MDNGEGVIIAFVFFFFLAFMVLYVAALWKIFEKAGKPGWAAIVPIYNLIVWMEIIRKPGHWVLLMLIPYIGVIWQVWALNLLVKSFGKDEGYTIGCLFLPFVFFPILGFGDAQYLGLPGAEPQQRQLAAREDILDDIV